uniref:Uncharacterized protein n=1 Tax=Tetraselmis chuii TaxID=63592 RepID=A0A7S1SU03_9CHLO|mmetsp:Transcript_29549/g.52915  ORF Transcript_29549/g.52915 Transcript_29549/m.52915 type:complete len:532 (+) Transcript_29549:157-1752(+)|eukprot:CAMPEP_0177786332 /NCGR_PEP_ID=MMETSP0491_2-20121128/20860_1 /TAXON_ID=63592 /ORGANISM="Tetraselmis chuii, Strain PLY429" /LENGTH=531 /DNA_ID=CAMNT_0019307523 /DNA_START=151 /DNA_END=1746 /DNA_ORIENTATION=+
MVSELPPPALSDDYVLDSSINLFSSWRQRVEFAETSAQTESQATRNAGTQTRKRAEAGAQVDDTELQLHSAFQAGAISESLGPFLERIAPVVEEILAENLRSTAFAEPDFVGDDLEGTVECAHELRCFPEGAPNPHQLVVTGVAWNESGNVVAASLGRHDVEGWCASPGALVSWNLVRRDLDPGRPDSQLETDSCLMCCAFHPRHPALIAGGTFNGQLVVWDLSREGDTQIGCSKSTDTTHREPICQVRWQYNAEAAARHANKDEAYHIITLGNEGRVLVWQWTKLDNPIYGYELVYRNPRSHKMVTWGATALAFQAAQKGDTGSFVAGAEGGAIFKCLLDHNEAMCHDFQQQLTDGKVPKLRSPVKADYSGHSGPVHDLSSSPFQRNIFASCGADGTLRVYNMLQVTPVMQLEPSESYLFGCRWSPFRPLVLAAAAGDGQVFLYDLNKSILHPVQAVGCSEQMQPVYALEFNHRHASYLATGHGSTVKVWAMGSRFTEEHTAEMGKLEQLAEVEGREGNMQGIFTDNFGM